MLQEVFATIVAADLIVGRELSGGTIKVSKATILSNLGLALAKPQLSAVLSQPLNTRLTRCNSAPRGALSALTTLLTSTLLYPPLLILLKLQLLCN